MNKEMLDLYTDYLISQTHLATATGLSNTLDGDVSHDQVTRFMHSGEFGSKELWQYVKSDIRKIENDEGVLIFDDTIQEKMHTDENDIMCWHFNHAKGRHVKGVNMLSGMVRYGDHALPVVYELVKKDLPYFDDQAQRQKRRARITKNELFRQMIQQTIANQVPFQYVLADNWFGAKANLHFIHFDCQKYFIIGMKSNRLVALSKEAKKRGQFQQARSLDWESGTCQRVYLKNVAMPVILLKKVFTNENGSKGTLYLVSNDLSIEADRMYDVYQKRWRIEEFHKSIKQNASFAKSPTKVERSQRNHIFASIISYCKLEFLSMKTAVNHFAIKYKLLIRANQVALKELRNMCSAA